jgi:hypothetical protein
VAPRAVVSFLLASLLLVPVAHATIVEALTMAELVQEADHAALVEVVALDAHYDELDRIVTDATVRVIEPLVGPDAPGDTFVVRRIGGRVGDLALRIEGEPSLQLGERVIVFVEEVAGVLRPVGMSQGVMRVVRDENDVEVVTPGGAGLSLVRPGGGALAPGRPALGEPTPVDEVLAEIRELGDGR